jgi:hypothetical protein
MNRARHLAEMRVALDRGCSLDAARAHLARIKWEAGQAALAKVRGDVRGEDAPAQAEPRAPASHHLKLWYVERD